MKPETDLNPEGCLIRRFGGTGNLLDELMQAANYCDDGLPSLLTPIGQPVSAIGGLCKIFATSLWGIGRL